MDELNENLFLKYLEINTNILLGKKSKKKDLFLATCGRLITSVETIPFGDKVYTETGNEACGMCKVNKEKIEGFETYSLYFYGITDSLQKKEKKFVLYEGIHEVCHACVNILTETSDKHLLGKQVDNELRLNRNGLIGIYDAKTLKPKDEHYYFKMFNETMMDIITTIGMECGIYESGRVDSVLKGSVKGENTRYKEFVPLTLLYISALSNNPNPNYTNIVNEGNGIVYNKTLLANGKRVYTNDFLYGFACDPLYIEDEFDKYTLKDEFKEICKLMDIYYAKNKKKYDDMIVKYSMKYLAKFIHNKLNNSKLFNKDEQIGILNNFKAQFVKTMLHYNVTFDSDELKWLREIGIEISDFHI